MLEFLLQHHRIGELPGLGAPGDGLVDATMDWVGEMVWRQELGDAFIRLVVCQ